MQELVARLALFGFVSTPVQLSVEPRARWERMLRAFLALFAAVVSAPLLFLIPPHAEWLLLSTAAGIYWFRKNWIAEYVLVAFGGFCPKCHGPVTIKPGTTLRFPHSVVCYACHEHPALELGPAPPLGPGRPRTIRLSHDHPRRFVHCASGHRPAVSGEMTIGFIGLGVMGRSMARHLRNAGHDLVVFNRTRSRADEIIGLGAQWSDSPRDVAAAADVVITMVGYPHDVEQIYFGADGIIENARSGALLVDMTTSTPSLARRIADAAKQRALHALDAPVSGGDIGAREARLTIMVGGDAAAFERALPVFQVMGKTINLMGGPGAGQHTKMCNQIAIAAGMLGVSEALAYAAGAGLDQTAMINTISTGAAASWSLSNYGPRIIKGDFAPGFYVKHFIKDMEIALQAAQEMGLETPGLELALKRYRELAARGGEDLGTQALYQLYRS